MVSLRVISEGTRVEEGESDGVGLAVGDVGRRRGRLERGINDIRAGVYIRASQKNSSPPPS